jgi:diguanylate cyclase (GGDEF)-like protein/PAS domain S-box-containing protein
MIDNHYVITEHYRRVTMVFGKDNGSCNGWDNINEIGMLLGNELPVCKFFNTMIEGMALNEIILDDGHVVDFRFLKINQSFERVSGLKEKPIVGKTVREILPDIEEYWISKIGNAVIKGEEIDFEDYCASLKKHFRVNVCPTGGKRFFVLFSDITKENEVVELSKRYQFLKENARDIILFIKEDGCIVEANNAASMAYGYVYEELIGMNISNLRASNYDCIMPEEKNAGGAEGVLYETLHKRKDGSVFNAEISSKGTIFNGEYIYLDIIRDITDRKQTEEKLHRLAYYDPVTDLPNKKYFSEYILKALSEAKIKNEKLAVFFIDLDRYKKVNDTMGHLIGDKLLKGAAERFKTLTNEAIFAARVGGDEFIFVQSGIASSEDAAELAYRILSIIKKPFIFDDEEIYITTSIGISLYPNHGEDSLTLMKNADLSMYRVKNNGRNNYEFYIPDMNKEAYEDLVIEKNLHHALENNELILHYQPKFNALSGEVIGMEALVRWQNPTLGLVPPIKFIGLAEESGLIVPIGKWVLKTACQQNRTWQKSGFAPMRVAVNLSVRQFEEGNLAEMVEDMLRQTGLEPKYLELEVTETMAMKNMELIIRNLRKLRNLGVHIALDDFGTGYSSLKYLKNIPVDTLKIDRSFINDLNLNPSYSAIIDAIINIAKKLELGIIAEGVETEEQSNFLIEKKCYEMQGYLFSKPVTKEEFEKLLKKTNTN